MITKIPRKRANPRPLLAYLDGKGDPERRLLDTNLQGRTPREMARELVAFSRSRRPGLAKLSKHMILSFAPGERPSEGELKSIAAFYLERMGYGEAPYAVYLHTDTGHVHLHIVTTPTSWDGRRVRESRDWPRSERVAREIEKRWGLRNVSSSREVRKRAATAAEVHAGERKAETSLRESFQTAVGDAARKATTFTDFLEDLSQQGFEIRLALDEAGMLRGISFAREGVHFRGSQLGRAFAGGNLLASFGLDYDPARDLAAVRAYSNHDSRRLTLMAVAEPQEKSAAPERMRPAGETMELNLGSLPEGRYQVVGIDPTRVKPHPDRIPQEAIAWRRDGWSEATVEEAKNWLSRENHTRMLLVRPEGATETHLAFRGVTKEQLGYMKAEGFEPAWVVKVGDQYDVLLRAHQRLSQADASALSGDLAARYDLAVPRGHFRDAVRLPGSAIHLPEGRELAQLVERRELPFSESEVVMEELRRLPEQREVALLAREETPALPRDSTPAAMAEEQVAARPSLPPDSPVARLQTEVEAAREWRAPEPLPNRSVEELLAGAREANRQALAALENSPAGVEPLASQPAVRELLSFEAELSRRRGALEEQLARLEPGVREKLERVETLARDIEARPDLDSIRRYQEAVQVFGEAQADYQAAERAHAQVLSSQATLDRERMGAAVAAEPERPALREIHRQATERELDLARQAGSHLELPVQPQASAEMLRRTLATWERHEPGLLTRLKEEGARALPAWERYTRDTILARAQLDRSEAARASEPRRLAAAVERGAEPAKVLQAMVDHQRSLVAHAAAERKLSIELVDPGDRLRQAAGRVAGGDTSPEALRRLNAELVRQVPREAIAPPLTKAPKEPSKLVERYLGVREDLVNFARRAAQPGAMDSQGNALLLARSTEALGLHQHVERLHRRMLGVMDPGQAPQGLSQGAWDLAWLRRATEKGMLPTEAQSHLGNVVRAPAAAGRIAAGKTLWIGVLAARWAASKLENYAQRVLTQG